MPTSALAELLDEATPHLIAEVEAAMVPATSEVPLRRTIARLPELMHGLVERLRADARTSFSIRFDIVPMVTALGLLKQSVYALIDERQFPVTTREVRTIGDWFAAVAESALLAENRRFGEMLDAIPDHILLYDADGLLINYVNRAVGEGAKDIAGMTRDEVLGHRIVDIVHDKEFGRYIEDCLKRVVRVESITDEFIYPSADGGHWHEQHMRPVYNLDGKVDSVVITSRDIHDRKKAEARLLLLSKLGALAETLEHEKIIDAMAHLSVPDLADWCLINIVDNRETARATMAHRDPAKATLARELLAHPSQLQELRVGAAAMAGESTILVDVDNAPDLARSEIVRRLAVRSSLVVPIVVMGTTVAIATFMMSESGRRYDAADLAVAQEMARRAEQMIENAKLHQQLRQSEARFRVALDQANISVFETDRELRVRWGYNSRLGAPVIDDAGSDLERLKRHVLETGEGTGRAFTAMLDGRKRHFMVRYEALRGDGEVVGLTGASDPT